MTSRGISPEAMTMSDAALKLRPLGIGELLDRAFNVFFKNAIPLISLLAVVIVPMAIVEYFMTRDILGAEFGIFQQAINHPTAAPDTRIVDQMNNALMGSVLGPWVGLYYLMLFIALPLANAAVVVGVSRAYLGGEVRFKDCYSVALRRWLPILLLVVMWFIALFAAMFTLVFAFIVVGVAIGALVGLLKGVGAVIGAIIGIAFALALVGFAIMAYMSFASSFIALVLENVDPIRAFGLGFSRIFGGGLFWRSVLMALAMLAIFIGFGLVAAAVAFLLFWFLKSPFIYVAVTQLVNLFFIAFAFVAVALYYYDVRIRREGFDLQVLADQIGGGRPAPSSTG